MNDNLKKITFLGYYIEPILKDTVKVYKSIDSATSKEQIFWFINKKKHVIGKVEFFDKWRRTE